VFATGSDLFESGVDNLGSYSHLYLKVVVKYLRGGSGSPIDYDPADVATLFHELLHHAQYISTVAGISYLDDLISIWNNARGSIESGGDAVVLGLISDARDRFNNFSDNNKNFDGGFFSDIDVEILDFDGSQINLDPITIEALLDGEAVLINFGINEFFESSAYVIERLFREKVGLPDERGRVPSVPYKIAEAIARYFDPCCSDSRLVMMLLTAMLHASPHQAFVKIAIDLSSVDWTDLETRANLEATALEMFRSNQEWAEERVSNIRNAFRLEDPHFGNLVVDLFRYAELFFQRRSLSPMLELDFLDELNSVNYASKVAEFSDLFGGVLIFKEKETEISRELEVEEALSLGTKKGVFHDLHKLEVFQASIHFALMHVCVKDEVVSVSLPNNVSPCPLLSSCCHKNKELNTVICSSHPWLHPQASDGSVDCAYQIAAYGFDLSNAGSSS